MKKEVFLDLLENKVKIRQLETVELKSVVEKYPFFQAARALYLKGLKNQDSFKYNNELKITAGYTTDRTVLFNYITASNFSSQQENIHQQISKKISKETLEENAVLKDKENISTTKEKTVSEIKVVEETLKIGKPIAFSADENHSFNQWLQLSTKKPIVRKEKNAVKKLLKKKN
ncbi:hypothetical protein [Polaribacter batillariae]|uniref:hypothetical protein n=1 Tax=Polaribacter batillariae TaxID=2808900 RepID=UPI00349E5EB7